MSHLILNGYSRLDVARLKTENPNVRFYWRKAVGTDNALGAIVICAGCTVPIGATAISEVEAMERARYASLETPVFQDKTRSATRSDIDAQLSRRMLECYGGNCNDNHSG